jgi:hypothetical protein
MGRWGTQAQRDLDSNRVLAGRYFRADAGTRTPDPLLTMEVLYRLSYVGAEAQLRALVGGAGFEPA